MSYCPPIAAGLVTLTLLALFLSSRFSKMMQDTPNERSLHSVPVPRIGGVGLIAGVLSGWALLFTSLVWWLVLPLAVLFIVSLLDDMRGLPVRQRLFAHLVAAAILVIGSGLLAQAVVVAVVVLLLTVWMTNLYNFMDGSNGLAGGMALFGFGMYAIAALISHNDTQAMLNLSVAAAALAFLFFNFNPARVFMGDAGSITLGFLAAAMGLWGWQLSLWGWWFPLLVFSPFVADATATLLKRALRGAKVTEAHREHYYQRAIQMGMRHRDVALFEYALMLAAGVTALFVVKQAFPWWVFVIWSIVYGVLMLLIDSAWNKFERRQHAEG